LGSSSTGQRRSDHVRKTFDCGQTARSNPWLPCPQRSTLTVSVTFANDWESAGHDSNEPGVYGWQHHLDGDERCPSLRAQLTRAKSMPPGRSRACPASISKSSTAGRRAGMLSRFRSTCRPCPRSRSARPNPTAAVPAELRWQSFQQDAKALNRLPDMQAALNFPDARRGRLDDWHAQILFQRRDDTERIQG